MVVRCASAMGSEHEECAQVIDLRAESGDWSGSWDAALFSGFGWRGQARDGNLVAIATGGCGRSPNIDDGSIDYPTGR